MSILISIIYLVTFIIGKLKIIAVWDSYIGLCEININEILKRIVKVIGIVPNIFILLILESLFNKTYFIPVSRQCKISLIKFH